MDVFQIRVAGDELGDVHARTSFKLDVRHQQAAASAGDQQPLFSGGKHLARFPFRLRNDGEAGKDFMLRIRFLRFQ